MTLVEAYRKAKRANPGMHLEGNVLETPESFTFVFWPDDRKYDPGDPGYPFTIVLRKTGMVYPNESIFDELINVLHTKYPNPIIHDSRKVKVMERAS